MTSSLYTTKELAQYRGPTTSDDYNARVENLYKDLVVLANRVGLTREEILAFYARMIKDHLSLTKVLGDLEERIEALEEDSSQIGFYSLDKIDNDRFVGTSFEVPTVNQCSYQTRYGLLTLPQVDETSVSKIRFVDGEGRYAIPPSFEAIARNVSGTADGPLAVIRSSDVFNAAYPEVGRIWERNVIVDAPGPDGAEVIVYMRLPLDSAISEHSNCIMLDPFPMMGVDLVDVGFTTAPNPMLSDIDVYRTLNYQSYHSGNSDAVGWISPGGWEDDEIISCGPKAFYFNPESITAIKIHLRQNNYFKESSKYIYTYGLSNLDVRLDKFLDMGKTIIRFDAPSGDVINSIDNVLPEIWNVAGSEHPYVFDYRVIWETSYNSDNYTTDPVPLSQRVWIELTLNKTVSGGTPAISALNVTYS
jgi:hypothetical protein